MNNDRLDWFRARVGKTVYRNVHDKNIHAPEPVFVHPRLINSFVLIEESRPVRYFDTPEEVIEYEKQLKK